jgi:23S rRNA (guanosine2251-2'-O)-methyltransferase
VRHRTEKPGELEISSLSAITHLLHFRPEAIRSLILSDRPSSRVDEIEALARQKGMKPTRQKGLLEGEGARALLTPFAFCELKELVPLLESKKHGLVVVLDHVQDPQNLGALCRSAEALGADAILIPRHRSASVTGAVFASSAGAVGTLPLCQVANTGEGLRQLKQAGFWAVGSTLGEGSTPIEAMPSFEKIALVLGAEGDGIAPLTASLCDWKIQIPLVGKVQSLNVSAAGAILIYELIRRQQRS